VSPVATGVPVCGSGAAATGAGVAVIIGSSGALMSLDKGGSAASNSASGTIGALPCGSTAVAGESLGVGVA